MAAFSRGLRGFSPRGDYICSRCLQFSTTYVVQSGHNRWSKIKHDKGAVDAKKNLQRSALSKEIVFASKYYGGDPNMNPRLAAVLVKAKKAGFPKSSVDAAIARGQGKSTSGLVLENITLEFIMPPSLAMIVDAESDNKNRTLADLRNLIRSHGGTVTPTSYLFQKKGRIAFESDERNLGVDDILDEAIEAGAEDVETDDDGNIVVWTEPSMVTSAAEALEKSMGLKVESSDIIWDANEDTKAPLENEETATKLRNLIDTLQDNPEIQGVYANASQGTLQDELWDELQERLDA